MIRGPGQSFVIGKPEVEWGNWTEPAGEAKPSETRELGRDERVY